MKENGEENRRVSARDSNIIDIT